jgi:hypothetical protein
MVVFSALATSRYCLRIDVEDNETAADNRTLDLGKSIHRNQHNQVVAIRIRACDGVFVYGAWTKEG